MTAVLLAMIRGYQMTFSKILPPSCRYYPSCSHYTYEAVARDGWLRRGCMSGVGISRCRPFAKGGYDPVPCSLVYWWTPGIYLSSPFSGILDMFLPRNRRSVTRV